MFLWDGTQSGMLRKFLIIERKSFLIDLNRDSDDFKKETALKETRS
jgi:hypothetical protein